MLYKAGVVKSHLRALSKHHTEISIHTVEKGIKSKIQWFELDAFLPLLVAIHIMPCWLFSAVAI